MTKLAVLVSGTGSILEAMLEQKLPVSLVLADRPCRGIEIADAAGVETVLIDRKLFGFKIGQDWDRDGFTRQVVEALQSHEIDLVAMAGFMTVFSEPMFDVYANRILNTHPALLPAFKGERAVADALEAGVKITGCTIHVATIELDAGPILAQAPVEVKDGDDVDSLWERIKRVERKLYPETIRKLMTKLQAPPVPEWASSEGPWCLKQWTPLRVSNPMVDTCLLPPEHEGSCRGIAGHFHDYESSMCVGQLEMKEQS